MQYFRILLEVAFAISMFFVLRTDIRKMKAKRHALNEFSIKDTTRYVLPMMWLTTTALIGLLCSIILQELIAISLYSFSPLVGGAVILAHLPFALKRKKLPIQRYEWSIIAAYFLYGAFIQLVFNQVYFLIRTLTS